MLDLQGLPRPVKSCLRYVLTLGIALRSFLLAPFGQRFRNIIWLISRHSAVGTMLGDVGKEWTPKIPRVKASDRFKTEQVVLPFIQPGDGNVSVLKLTVLAAMMRHFKPRRVFEIGTFNGLTTLTMALNSPPETEIFTLDLPASQEESTRYAITEGERVYVRKPTSGEYFHRGHFAEEKKIHQIYGDSATFDYAPYAGGIDLVFVDGSHAYDYVISDTRNARALLTNGKGVIVWHDYNTFWPDVIRALEEMMDKPEGSAVRNIEGTAIVYLDRT